MQPWTPAAGLAFLLVGTLVLLPVILMYSYRVFRGKVRSDMGYH
jgi:cytochrome bd ubiquinol oxidase subunit II